MATGGRPPNKPSIPPRPAPRPKPVKRGWQSMADNQLGQLGMLPFTRVEKHRAPGKGECCFAGHAVKAVWLGKFRLAARLARLDVKTRLGYGLGWRLY